MKEIKFKKSIKYPRKIKKEIKKAMTARSRNKAAVINTHRAFKDGRVEYYKRPKIYYIK